MRLKYYQSIIISLLLASLTLAQEKNPTTYPYGGVVDYDRYEPWMENPPVDFKRAIFNFKRFDATADFIAAQFDSTADFTASVFDSAAFFIEARFDSAADFVLAQFDSTVDFGWAEFYGTADFGGARFHGPAIFRGVQFHGTVDFKWAYLNEILLTSTIFHCDVYLGAIHKQKFDFTQAILYPDAKIILFDLVELSIQTERVKHIAFGDTLRYSLKSRILDDLKDSSFKENKKAQFELDYIFHKSTMYQHQIDTESMGFLRKIANFIYYITMGFGYRPFRLVWWILGIIMVYSLIYVWTIRREIHDYIFRDEKQEATETRGKKLSKRTGSSHPVDLFIDCLYFSSTMFFTVRLKKDILTGFQSRARWIIISEWLIGILIYLAFLTLSKSGSILHTLKSLFAG